ncbi:MAG: hypothetical protein LR015_00835 [Verrucomicrobia bacterium]|nr:hypothetical protein [Verrucomicrobiota bacterium]
MKHLIPWFERLLSPLEPIPTDSVSTRVPWDTYTCAVFDVYGTLLISASGDIGLSTEANRTQAMAKTMDRMQIGLKVLPGDLVARLHATILRHQDWVRSQGVQYPEVEIREVWLELLDECQREDLIHLPQRLDVPLSSRLRSFLSVCAILFGQCPEP